MVVCGDTDAVQHRPCQGHVAERDSQIRDAERRQRTDDQCHDLGVGCRPRQPHQLDSGLALLDALRATWWGGAQQLRNVCDAERPGVVGQAPRDESRHGDRQVGTHDEHLAVVVEQAECPPHPALLRAVHRIGELEQRCAHLSVPKRRERRSQRRLDGRKLRRLDRQHVTRAVGQGGGFRQLVIGQPAQSGTRSIAAPRSRRRSSMRSYPRSI